MPEPTGQVDTEFGRRRSARGWWALTGTPGTGKSTVLRRLAPHALGVELAGLARAAGAAPAPSTQPLDIDLTTLSRFVRAHPPEFPTVVAGHLSHLLPVRRVIVLRCHPLRLRRRLRRSRPSLPADELAENVEAEALDLVAAEARRDRRSIVEVDTTNRSPVEVADRVLRIVGRPDTPSDRVDWLADARVRDRLRLDPP
jgi:adenylate kinase